MAMPNAEGRYRAVVMDVAADKDKNGKPFIVFQFSLTEEFDDENWRPTRAGQEIRSYQYLLKKDGDLNEVAVNQLKEAFGWTGEDPYWFEDTHNSVGLLAVQLELDWETYNGKDSLKVKWVNPYNYEGRAGGFKHAEKDDRRVLMAEIGSKLRAHSTPAPAAKPAPASKPPASAPPSGPSAAKSTLSYTSVWDDFAARALTAKIPDSDRDDMWNKRLNEVVEPAQDPTAMNAAQLARLASALGNALVEREQEDAQAEDGLGDVDNEG